MRTEKEKMLAGELYDPRDDQLLHERHRARLLTKAFNDSSDDQGKERKRLLLELFGTMGKGTFIEPPFHCDYGGNITLGERVFFNFNCVILDVAAVTIGARSVIGAGSVVTKSVPEEVFAGGNPCRVIRSLGSGESC
ncbi:sugar O-acetyltransferase [Billgrantia azerbaijanica]|nr:sugar O-acetyltransferase [Halomonas azerbaijanica]